MFNFVGMGREAQTPILESNDFFIVLYVFEHMTNVIIVLDRTLGQPPTVPGVKQSTSICT